VTITQGEHVATTAPVSAADADPALSAPLRRDLSWGRMHQMSQSPAYRDDATLRAIRATATVRRGTRMVKVLSAAQFAGYRVTVYRKQGDGRWLLSRDVHTLSGVSQGV